MADNLNERFILRQSSRFLDPVYLEAILKGNAAAYLIKGMIPDADCARIADNFDQVAQAKRDDKVPGICIGAFHYGKTTDQYFNEVAASAEKSARLLVNSTDPVATIHREFSSAFSLRNFFYRPAASFGRHSARFVARAWTDTGEYALAPHEDVAQLHHPAQRGFEIQAVARHTVVGINLCIRSNETGGALIVWDVRPDDQDRLRFGVQHTGYPYPADFVGSSEQIRLYPRAGDVYCVNGNLLHAVEQRRERTSITLRLNLSFICGFIDSDTIVYWT